MQVDHPSPRSLILDLLSTLRRGSMPVAALVEAAELFEIPSGSLRVALARLHRAGQVIRDRRGRYALGPETSALQGLVGNWRQLESRTRSWEGSWLAVHRSRDGSRPTQKGSDRALQRLGFRALRTGLHVRPANLRGGSRATRTLLLSLGLETSALLFQLRELESGDDAEARGLWDLTTLSANYRSSLRKLQASTRRLASASDEHRMVETFLVGGSVIQQLVADPLLPEAILPGEDRRTLVEAMRAYDRLGRSCWGSLLAGHGVPHRSAPIDTRLLDREASIQRLRG